MTEEKKVISINNRSVKCPACLKTFKRVEYEDGTTNFWYDEKGKRHYHAECKKEVSESKIQRDKLFDMLIEKWGKGNVNFQHISKQIKNFTEENGYTLSGIVGTVDYLLNHQKKIDMTNSKYGIAIVPYKYNEARDYFQKKAEIANFEYKEAEEKEIVIERPKSKRNEGLIDIGEMFD